MQECKSIFIYKILILMSILAILLIGVNVSAATLTKIDNTKIYNINYNLLAECDNLTQENRCSTNAVGIQFVSSSIYTDLRYNSTYNMKFQVSYGGQDVQFADVNSFGMYLIDANGRNQGNITCESGGWSNETDSDTRYNYIVHNIDCDFEVNVNNIKGIGFNQTMNSIQGVIMFLESDIQINLLNSDAAIIENQNQNQQQTNERLDDVNDNLTDISDSLTDSSPPDMDALADTAGWLPPGPLDTVLNLPLTILNALTNIFNKSCESALLPLPFVNKNIELPCIQTLYGQINGLSSFLNWITIPLGAYILFKYFMHLYEWVDKTLTFRENNYIDNWGGV